MVDFYVTADGGSESEVTPVANAIKAAGYSVQTGSTGPNAEALRNNGTVKPPTKLVFIVNGGQAGQTYGSFALDYSDGMCFTIFAFDNYRTHYSTTTEDALKNKKLVSEWDSGSFATDSIANDIKGHTTCSYQNKYPHIFAFVTSETSAEDLGKKIASGNYTCGKGSSSSPSNEEDEDEDWGDRDNFTPHKGKIMEIKPYKEIHSISFDKSYDSPTGTGKIETLYSSKDYRFIYDGVAMKLKLRRSCDNEWSDTGLEDSDYEENEKFFKEHIPTPELLKELGIPDYRKIQRKATNTSSSSGSSIDDGSTGNSSSSNTSSGSSSISGNSSNNTGNSSAPLTHQPTSGAIARHSSRSVKSDAQIKKERRRALGFYW